MPYKYEPTYQELLNHQDQDLAKWKSLLKPEVYAQIEKQVQAAFSLRVDPNAQVQWFSTEEHSILRGDSITELVLNLKNL